MKEAIIWLSWLFLRAERGTDVCFGIFFFAQWPDLVVVNRKFFNSTEEAPKVTKRLWKLISAVKGIGI